MSQTYPDLPRTNFPDGVDNFDNYSDANNSTDISLINQIQSYMTAGNFNAAQEILANNPNLYSKLLNADKMNKFRDILVALERYYQGDYSTYINKKQAEWQQIIDEFSYIGEYSSTKIYNRNNMVLYDEKLYLYINPTSNSNIPPNNETYWRLLTIKGENGESGKGLSFGGEYDSTTTYFTDDLILYQNNLWISTQDNNINNTPSSTSEYWELIMSPPPAASYILSETQPELLGIDELWFKIGKVVE